MQTNLSILLADDDPEDLELIEEAILTIEPGAKLNHVYSGKEVIHFLKSCSDAELPDLILLDYNMPQMTGAEILITLSKESRYKEILKMVLSTSNAEMHIKQCVDNGAIQYFIKPFDMKGLAQLATNMLAIVNFNQKSSAGK